MLFLRYVNTKEQAEKDLERKYSFTVYQLEDTPELLAANVAEFYGYFTDDGKADAELFLAEHSDEIAQDNATAKWGIAKAGLCGYGPFSSIDEAQAAHEEMNAYGAATIPVIFEGTQIDDVSGEGDTLFVPEMIVKC